MELRKQHGIDVPEAEYRQLESLDSSANYLLPKFESGATAIGKLSTDSTNTGNVELDFTAAQNFLLNFTGNVCL